MTGAARQGRSRGFVIGAIAAALVSAAFLAGLGLWQVERLQWKLDLISRVEQRVSASPMPPPPPSAWPSVSRDADEYLKVEAKGRFLTGKETLVQAVTALGSGFWVLTPFQTDDGFTILVNRGFVPQERRDPASRREGTVDGETRVTGLLRLTEPGGAFLRSNDAAANRWYSRDVAAIAQARGLTGVAPYFVDADATPNPGGWPVGGLTVVSFNNHHLIYAFTWFGLSALALFGAWRLARDIAKPVASSVKSKAEGKPYT